MLVTMKYNPQQKSRNEDEEQKVSNSHNERIVKITTQFNVLGLLSFGSIF